MKNRVVVIAALVLAFLAVGSSEAYADFKTFMFVPGVPGDATDVNHPAWIEILSLSQGASALKKAVVCSDLSVLKSLDQAGPPLWAAAAMGQVFPQVHIEIVRTIGEVQGVIYDIRLNNARVTSTQMSSSSELPTDSVSFSYQSLTIQFNIQSPKGDVTPGVPQTINCQ